MKRIKGPKFLQYSLLYVMMLPGLVYFAINNYMPMFGIVVAFKRYNVNSGIFLSPWHGLKNFEYLFSTAQAFIIIRNTLLYNIVFIAVNTFVAITLAIIISDVMITGLRKIYQSAILFPLLISIVVVSYIVFGFLSHENGMLNKSIRPLLGLRPKQWYNETSWWPFILVLVHCWKTVGYGTLIYIAGIAGIDKAFYEAAEIDGAGKWQQIWRITVPCLIPSIVTILLVSIGRIFYSDFGLFYQVPQNSGSLFAVTNTIDTYVYRALISAGGIGRSAAAGLFQSIVGFTLVFSSNTIVRKISSENAIF
jgi:putative aldouronate transport system permease protein